MPRLLRARSLVVDGNVGHRDTRGYIELGRHTCGVAVAARAHLPVAGGTEELSAVGALAEGLKHAAVTAGRPREKLQEVLRPPPPYFSRNLFRAGRGNQRRQMFSSGQPAMSETKGLSRGRCVYSRTLRALSLPPPANHLVLRQGEVVQPWVSPLTARSPTRLPFFTSERTTQ